MSDKIKVNWDGVGIVTSVACAIHCAVLPLFLSSLPLLGFNVIHNSYFEAGMITLAFVVGCFSLFHGYKRHHHHLLPLFIFSLGFPFLVLKYFFVTYEKWLLVPAVVFIISAHYFNYRFCRKANHCHETDCNH